MAFDFDSLTQMMKLLKNTKATDEDTEAYKYSFSQKGKRHTVCVLSRKFCSIF